MDDKLFSVHEALNIHNFVDVNTETGTFRRCECGRVQIFRWDSDGYVQGAGSTGANWHNCSVFGQEVVEEDLFKVGIKNRKTFIRY